MRTALRQKTNSPSKQSPSKENSGLHVKLHTTTKKSLKSS
jgi:hypothetical protein